MRMRTAARGLTLCPAIGAPETRGQASGCPAHHVRCSFALPLGRGCRRALQVHLGTAPRRVLGVLGDKEEEAGAAVAAAQVRGAGAVERRRRRRSHRRHGRQQAARVSEGHVLILPTLSSLLSH